MHVRSCACALGVGCSTAPPRVPCGGGRQVSSCPRLLDLIHSEQDYLTPARLPISPLPETNDVRTRDVLLIQQRPLGKGSFVPLPSAISVQFLSWLGATNSKTRAGCQTRNPPRKKGVVLTSFILTSKRSPHRIWTTWQAACDASASQFALSKSFRVR